MKKNGFIYYFLLATELAVHVFYVRNNEFISYIYNIIECQHDLITIQFYS